MITRQLEGLRVVQSEQLLEVGVPHGWFGVSLGNTMFRPNTPEEEKTEVRERWARACKVLGMNSLRLARTNGLLQTDKVSIITAEHAGTVTPEGDGYVTKEKGLPVMLRAADCIQTVLYDPAASVLGIVHAGGLGTARGIMPKTVHRMQNFGAQPERILASIGPSIAPEHFVPTQEADGFTLADLPIYPVTKRLEDGRVGYDVAATNTVQLRQCGVASEHIDVSEIDTFTSQDFFSWERERLRDPEAAMARHGLFVSLPE